MSELALRSIFGLLYASAIVVTVLFYPFVFNFLIFVFGSLAVFEFQKLLTLKSVMPIIILGLLAYGFYFNLIGTRFQYIMLIIVNLTNLGLAVWLLIPPKEISNLYVKTHLVLFYFIGSCYFILASSKIIPNLKGEVTLYIYSMVWVYNTFAFVVGRKWGRHKLIEKVSPKKTWEGFVGGILSCVILSLVYSQFYTGYFSLWIFALSSVLIPVLAAIGDLVQSKFKRIADVKDSGTLFPGHGGFFDRMDSIIFTMPFIYGFLVLIRYVS